MIYPFILTTLAGLATLLGTLPIFFNIKNKNLIIASSCSFASGVMICLSIFDLIPESIEYIRKSNNELITIILTFIFLIVGIFCSNGIEIYIDKISKKTSLFKVGIISMIAIIIHNIPEGIVTFIVSNKNILLGVSICIAIALHNIPEGISIAIPVYYSTKSKKKALLYTLISALSEPLGAMLTYLFLSRIINDLTLGLIFSFTAGIMFQISIGKLLPTGMNYKKRTSYIFFIIGFITMLISLFLNTILLA